MKDFEFFLLNLNNKDWTPIVEQIKEENLNDEATRLHMITVILGEYHTWLTENYVVEPREKTI